MHTGNQKEMNASYQASLVNRHLRRFTGNGSHRAAYLDQDKRYWLKKNRKIQQLSPTP